MRGFYNWKSAINIANHLSDRVNGKCLLERARYENLIGVQINYNAMFKVVQCLTVGISAMSLEQLDLFKRSSNELETLTNNFAGEPLSSVKDFYYYVWKHTLK